MLQKIRLSLNFLDTDPNIFFQLNRDPCKSIGIQFISMLEVGSRLLHGSWLDQSVRKNRTTRRVNTAREGYQVQKQGFC